MPQRVLKAQTRDNDNVNIVEVASVIVVENVGQEGISKDERFFARPEIDEI